MDAPEKIKKKYLLSYEKERAKEILGIPQMMPGFNPKTSDMEEVYEWHLKQEKTFCTHFVLKKGIKKPRTQ